MIKTLEDVRLFMEVMKQPILPRPHIPASDRQVLRAKLIRGEYLEFVEAWDECALARNPGIKRSEQVAALAKLADALTDLVYVIDGTAHEYGIPFEEIWDVVQEANMNKLWTEQEVESIPAHAKAERVAYGDQKRFVVRDDNGKVMKPPSWTAPEPKIEEIISRHMEKV